MKLSIFGRFFLFFGFVQGSFCVFAENARPSPAKGLTHENYISVQNSFRAAQYVLGSYPDYEQLRELFERFGGNQGISATDGFYEGGQTSSAPHDSLAATAIEEYLSKYFALKFMKEYYEVATSGPPWRLAQSPAAAGAPDVSKAEQLEAVLRKLATDYPEAFDEAMSKTYFCKSRLPPYERRQQARIVRNLTCDATIRLADITDCPGQHADVLNFLREKTFIDPMVYCRKSLAKMERFEACGFDYVSDLAAALIKDDVEVAFGRGMLSPSPGQSEDDSCEIIYAHWRVGRTGQVLAGSQATIVDRDGVFDIGAGRLNILRAAWAKKARLKGEGNRPLEELKRAASGPPE